MIKAIKFMNPQLVGKLDILPSYLWNTTEDILANQSLLKELLNN